nr:single-stranded DNA-binding protein [Nitrosomonas nitrosa]
MSAYAQITGHLGQDVELRQTNGGVSVVNLSLASNRTRKDDSGEKVSLPDWFRITVYGRDAEVLAQYAHKGSALAFNGRLQTDSYFDREGGQRSTTVLIADSFEFMPRGKRAEAEDAASKNKGRNTSSDFPKDDSDIPF